MLDDLGCHDPFESFAENHPTGILLIVHRQCNYLA